MGGRPKVGKGQHFFFFQGKKKGQSLGSTLCTPVEALLVTEACCSMSGLQQFNSRDLEMYRRYFEKKKTVCDSYQHV